MPIVKTIDGYRIELEGDSEHFLFYGITNADLAKAYLENLKDKNMEKN
jgi:hypothetical protein